jgi:excinuclease ABC subunit A
VPHYISVKGARENNLKGIDVQIPHNKFVVITGVSGSGKSSLAFDTIFREGQRKYLETFSSAARQLISKLQRPDIDSIEGLTPCIAVNQATVIRNPHSTLGTLSELHDYLRLLFARFGKSDNKNLIIERQLFSFNHPKGACPICSGLGLEEKITEDKLISDPGKSIREGALAITAPNGYIIYSQVTLDVLNKVCNAHGFDIDIPWQKMTREQKNIILFGSDIIRIPYGKHTLESRMKWSGITAKPREEGHYKGIIPVMEDILKRDRNKNILRFAESRTCSVCHGSRLNEKALSVTFRERNLASFTSMTVEALKNYFEGMKEDVHEGIKSIRQKILDKCVLLEKLGLGYLSLDRTSNTLSGGEAQRIRLANQITNGLQGITYVFDEPSIGLHESEQDKMLEVLNGLVDNGNSLIVVEHDERSIRRADHLIDIGPDAGIHGGNLSFSGRIKDLLSDSCIHSHTKNYLLQRDIQPIEKSASGEFLFYARNCTKNNLRNIDVTFKGKMLNVICGVSGAGKSSLVEDLLKNSVEPQTHGCANFNSFEFIDQSPIGRTPRSNPATYTKVFDPIRKLFGDLPESRAKGWDKSRFSFNVKGGRCESCEGAGYQQIGMHFLGNVDVVCEQCQGHRFNQETLSIKYKGKSINDVLNMTIEEACLFFFDQKNIHRILASMLNLGLGYIGLGQSSTTLSGGEAQRIKLASALWKSGKGSSLFILDEPTTGLHHKDVQMLLTTLNALIQNGHTIITIEHHPEVIKAADNLLELGPGSGEKGGELVFSGSPAKLLDEGKTLTAKYLNEELKTHQRDHAYHEAHFIELRKVATHNLKNIDVDIPRNKLSVVTGVSGSGKSSFVFDTLYAEGQRRFLESISTYARSFMKSMDKPILEEINNLNPVIAIGQKTSSANARSTVGTLSEVYDFYRLLYSRIAKQQCPHCQEEISRDACVCGKTKRVSITASHFSFNLESGACPLCKGLGVQTICDPEKLISHPERSLFHGAMDGHKSGKFYGDFHGQYVAILQSVGREYCYDYEKSWESLSQEARDAALYGTAEKEYAVEWHYKRKNREGVESFRSNWGGLCQLVNEEYQRKHADKRGDALLPIMKEECCSLCKAKRLKQQSLQFKFQGLDIADLAQKSITDSISFFESLDVDALSSKSKLVLQDIMPSVISKLKMMNQAGLGYLNMNRNVQTLSGGELQRLRLASSLGSGLCGITYVLDEPTVGLHARDTRKLIEILQELKKQDNTLVVVEHDSDMIKAADHVIEIGPGAGEQGGYLMSGERKEETISLVQKPPTRQKPEMGVKIRKASVHNLKDITLTIPVSGCTLFTGVSGSGKTSLLFNVIYESYQQRKAINCQSIKGLDAFDSLVAISQYRMSQHPTSIVATYSGVMDDIRKVFSETKEAQMAGFKKADFSFTNKKAACPECKGMGQIKINMDFLSDVWSVCEACQGKRYSREVLSIEYRGNNISKVLNMNVDKASCFFEDHESIQRKLTLMNAAGLGYVSLGQLTRSLSGGESQRLKLATDLISSKGNRNLYLFDEPSKGLHTKDVELLLELFKGLIRKGHCLYIIEHNLQIISQADWVIDLGPEGGDRGGRLVFEGLVAGLIQCKESYTGKALAEALKG